MQSGGKQSVYSILSKLIGLKFSSELKDSGIELERIYRMTNLETGKEIYLLEVNNTEIRFVTSYDFAFHFSRFLSANIEYSNKEYDRLVNLNTNEFTDDVRIEMRYKELDCYRFKQGLLLKKIEDFKSKIRGSN